MVFVQEQVIIRYYVITLTELYHDCLNFSYNYFDKTVVMGQGSLTRDIRNTHFNNSLEGCFGNLNLIDIGRG